MLQILKNPHGVLFKVFVLPKSSKNMIAGLYGDAIKVKLTAPPVDGAANKMCLKYLAKSLKVPKSSLEIVSGHAGRTKHLLLRYKDKTDSSESEYERFKRLIESLLIKKEKT